MEGLCEGGNEPPGSLKAKSAMGACVNAQKYENSDYVAAVNEMKAILSERLAKPLLAFDFIFNFTKWSNLQKKSLEIIHGFAKKVIRERKQQRLKNIQEHFPEDDEYFGQKKRIAFLDMLLDASEDGNKLTDEEIQEEVDTFMFGGHDTIAAAISTSLYLLGLNPEIQMPTSQSGVVDSGVSINRGSGSGTQK
ncbi:hypothetical protein ANN_03466 [Periplaneta americana]|uniref:Cytochrome P450 n=1 Tax=Periplaneta americana TaxID=6978 RepID=A0ABQ8U2N9_PERAM|nr:hypothetical protein ANN_03466 [Periplaneta americana]